MQRHARERRRRGRARRRGPSRWKTCAQLETQPRTVLLPPHVRPAHGLLHWSAVRRSSSGRRTLSHILTVGYIPLNTPCRCITPTRPPSSNAPCGTSQSPSISTVLAHRRAQPAADYALCRTNLRTRRWSTTRQHPPSRAYRPGRSATRSLRNGTKACRALLRSIARSKT